MNVNSANKFTCYIMVDCASKSLRLETFQAVELIQQSVVSRMLCKTYFPKEPATLQAVKSWMTMKKQGKIYLDE